MTFNIVLLNLQLGHALSRGQASPLVLLHLWSFQALYFHVECHIQQVLSLLKPDGHAACPKVEQVHFNCYNICKICKMRVRTKISIPPIFVSKGMSLPPDIVELIRIQRPKCWFTLLGSEVPQEPSFFFNKIIQSKIVKAQIH